LSKEAKKNLHFKKLKVLVTISDNLQIWCSSRHQEHDVSLEPIEEEFKNLYTRTSKSASPEVRTYVSTPIESNLQEPTCKLSKVLIRISLLCFNCYEKVPLEILTSN
jgi:hypothetical protein